MLKRKFHVLALGGIALLSTIAIPENASARDTSSTVISQHIADVDGYEIEVFSYHPKGCASPSLLMVFHGNGRGARSYLKSAIDLADRGCFVIYAPLFDKERFPNWSYHRGGVVRKGQLRPEQDWTTELVDDLVDWAQDLEGRGDIDSFLFGHSAGGQFLSRVAAYDLPPDVDRIIIANPSTYVLPSVEEDAPYGFGRLSEAASQTWMQAYLAAPITIFLGTDDTGSKDLTMTRAAIRQGKNRLERGQRAYDQAKATAERHGWAFNWKLVYAQDVGHSGRRR